MPTRLLFVNDNSQKKPSNQWAQLAPSATIAPRFRKRDFEHFHFGLLQIVDAVLHIQGSQRALLNSDVELAQKLNDMATGEVSAGLRLLQEFYVAFTEQALYDGERIAAENRRRTKRQKVPSLTTG